LSSSWLGGRISPPAALEALRHGGKKKRKRLTTEGAEDTEVGRGKKGLTAEFAEDAEVRRG
jgi:hypothetical protein